MTLVLAQFIAIAAAQDNTTVTVTRNGGKKRYLIKNNLLSGKLILERKANLSLSGVTVTSDKPFALISGSICRLKYTASKKQMKREYKCDFAVAFLAPIQDFGTTFALAPLSKYSHEHNWINNHKAMRTDFEVAAIGTEKLTYRIVTETSDEAVTNTVEELPGVSGALASKFRTVSELQLIQFDRPVQLILLGSNMDHIRNGEIMDPPMILIPAIEMFGDSRVTFSTTVFRKTSHDHNMIIWVQKNNQCKDVILMQEGTTKKLPVQSAMITGFSKRMVFKRFNLQNKAMYTIEQVDNNRPCPYQAILYGRDGDASYGFPLMSQKQDRSNDKVGIKICVYKKDGNGCILQFHREQEVKFEESRTTSSSCNESKFVCNTVKASDSCQPVMYTNIECERNDSESLFTTTPDIFQTSTTASSTSRNTLFLDSTKRDSTTQMTNVDKQKSSKTGLILPSTSVFPSIQSSVTESAINTKFPLESTPINSTGQTRLPHGVNEGTNASKQESGKSGLIAGLVILAAGIALAVIAILTILRYKRVGAQKKPAIVDGVAALDAPRATSVGMDASFSESMGSKTLDAPSASDPDKEPESKTLSQSSGRN